MFTYKQVMNFYIVSEINLWALIVGKDFVLGNSLFAVVKLTKYSNPDKYKYSGYDTGFDAFRSFSLSDGSEFGKSVIVFGTNMSLSVHIDYKKDTLILV